MNKTTKSALWAIPVVAAAGVAAVLFCGPAKRQGRSDGAAGPSAAKGRAVAAPAAVSNAAVRSVAAVAPKGTGSVAAVKGPVPSLISGTNSVPRSADQVAADLMQESLDNNDDAGTLKIARTLMKSKEKAVRSQVVSALGWVGVKALPELSQMLNDGEPDIEREAFQQWTASLNEIESEDMQQQMLISGMLTMQDLDSLEESVMMFSQMDPSLAAQGMVQVIESGNALAASVTREHYEHMTGQAYTTAAAATEWAKENATPKPSATAATKK